MTRTRLPKLEGGMTREHRDTYHVETGPTHQLPCWCTLDRDHTFQEFIELAADAPGEPA